ncbi:class II glutamine amidotransferase [Microvirga flavescens]|uniref:class II glutamine amidotransferase n=1 Tax=Microvirga flavescens TaxID=2249811 RepID=UPI000DD97CBE|nr:class II glutamine amidotransferase [Microvirga flavescens]
MCRFLAYRGESIFLADLVCAPAHSLVHQSLHAIETKTETNGDGFGIGWYRERREPGVYREVRPAWSDENLRSLCDQVRSSLFFAHVRAATGTATMRANCHPFAHGRHLFMHNGQIGGYKKIKRRLEAMIPDGLYDTRHGTTDSEAIFLLALANGLAEDPVAAMARTLKIVRGLMDEAGIDEPFKFTAAVTDGEDLYAYRWSCDAQPPTLYFREVDGNLLIVSEPIDDKAKGWQEVPKGCSLIARAGRPIEVECLNEAMGRLAA